MDENKRMYLNVVWSFNPEGEVRAQDIALMTHQVVFADDLNFIYLFNDLGELQWKRELPIPPVDIKIESEGKWILVLCEKGNLFLLNGDGKVYWQRSPEIYVNCIDARYDFSWIVAGAQSGNFYTFNQMGDVTLAVETTREISYINIIQNYPLIIVSNDLGLIQCYLTTGEPNWRISSYNNIGKPSASSTGNILLFPAYTIGALAYTKEGEAIGIYDVGQMIELAQVDWFGKSIFVVDSKDRFIILGKDGSNRFQHQMNDKITFFNADYMGEYFIFADQTGRITCYHLQSDVEDSSSFLEVKDYDKKVVASKNPLWVKRLTSPTEVQTSFQLALNREGNQIALFDGNHHLKLFNEQGRQLPLRETIKGAFSIMRPDSAGVCFVVISASQMFKYHFDSTKKYRGGGKSQIDVIGACLAERGRYLAIADDVGGVTLYDEELREIWHKSFSMLASDFDIIDKEDIMLVVFEDGSIQGIGLTGSFRWERRIKNDRIMRVGQFLDNFIVVSSKGMVAALDATANKLWSVKLPAVCEDLYALDNVLVCKTDKTYYLIDSNGNLTKEQDIRRGAAIIFKDRVHKDLYELHQYENNLALKTIEGETLWKYKTDEFISAIAVNYMGTRLAFQAASDLHYMAILDASEEPPSETYLEL